MAHDLENPRTKNYSKFKSFLISLELVLKKGWLFIFVIINIFFHTKKNNYIDIGNYKNKDSRFINFLFKSLKSKYNFSYNISLSILDFVKKVGIKNFVLNSTPNIFVKKSNKIKFNLNCQNQDGLNFNTNYFYKHKEEKLYLPYYMYPKIYNSNYEDLEKFKLKQFSKLNSPAKPRWQLDENAIFYLRSRGIDAKIHYPIPMHLQPAAKKFGYKKGDFPITEKISQSTISLPVHEFVKKSDIYKVSKLINNILK